MDSGIPIFYYSKHAAGSFSVSPGIPPYACVIIDIGKGIKALANCFVYPRDFCIGLCIGA